MASDLRSLADWLERVGADVLTAVPPQEVVPRKGHVGHAPLIKRPTEVAAMRGTSQPGDELAAKQRRLLQSLALVHTEIVDVRTQLQTLHSELPWDNKQWGMTCATPSCPAEVPAGRRGRGLCDPCRVWADRHDGALPDEGTIAARQARSQNPS
jgi:hypothetical protein